MVSSFRSTSRPPIAKRGHKVTAGPRLEWLDTARGLAVTLVVLYHAVLFAESIAGASGVWSPVIRFFQPLRLPLLFFVSGMLSSSAVRRSWGWLARNRIGTLLWCYGLWTALTFIIFGFVPYTRPDAPGRGLGPMMESLMLPHTGLWYLLSLAAMVVAAKLLGRVPSWLVLPVTAILSAVVSSDVFGVGLWWSWANTLSYAFFFFLGLEFREGTILMARVYARAWPASLTAACYVIVLGLVGYFGLQKFPGVYVVLSLFAIGASLLISATIGGRKAAVWLSRIGAMTLPIYVTHEIVIGILAAAVQAVGTPGFMLGLVLPLLFSAAGLLTGIWLNHVAGTVPGIFRAPWRASPDPRRLVNPST
ncbi:acyltransferase family protein [Pseudarthrobacter oxydans]|uniref:acyltransferase family protein n=1 Tax=Pseudarthrobacter oxydans TaxID=1671 RepID=UPI00341206CE